MRELKFRIWDGNSFLRSYADKGESFEFPKDFGKIVGLDWFIQCQRLESPQRFWVQQFTGLKDKNGVEIYEGDIVEYKIKVFGAEDVSRIIVDFYRGEFVGKWPDSPVEKSIPLYIEEWCDGGENPQVIGNIFENSDLLN